MPPRRKPARSSKRRAQSGAIRRAALMRNGDVHGARMVRQGSIPFDRAPHRRLDARTSNPRVAGSNPAGRASWSHSKHAELRGPPGRQELGSRVVSAANRSAARFRRRRIAIEWTGSRTRKTIPARWTVQPKRKSGRGPRAARNGLLHSERASRAAGRCPVIMRSEPPPLLPPWAAAASAFRLRAAARRAAVRLAGAARRHSSPRARSPDACGRRSARRSARASFDRTATPRDGF